uniref:Costunolide synthase n=1 Tax=Opuntia streptacantha TaxID=393608 RepID=A0A7C8ZDY4_OPUST
MLGQNTHRALAQLAQKYGPIMSLRLGQVPTIVVSSAQAAKLFLKQHDAVFANRPRLLAWDHIGYGAKDVAFTPHGEYWRRMRKMCTLHLLSVPKVAEFEGLRRAEIEWAVRRLAEARDAVDVGERMGKFFFFLTPKEGLY